MNRIKCTIAYDGSDFSGFQIQPSLRTVQGKLELALQKMHKGKKVRLHASGRTDSGVHAICQVFHFDTTLEIPATGWKQALTTLVPPDIQIKSVEQVAEDFHARYSATEKEYRYYVLNQSEPDIFRRRYMHHTSTVYQLDWIKQACYVFEGTHDFTSFASAKSTVKGSKVRTISEVSCRQDGDVLQFTFRGNGFLQHMVRIIVGALLDAGKGKHTAEELAVILELKERMHTIVTVPPEGLYLWNVTYG